MNRQKHEEYKTEFVGDNPNLTGVNHNTTDLDLSQFSTGNLFFDGEEELKSVNRTNEGTIEVVTIRHRGIAQWPEPPKLATKKIYKAKDGQIYLADEIKGKVIPEKTIPQKIEWDS